MKIGILITSIGNFGKKGFYNAQEVGLARALSPHFSGVIIYKLIPADEKRSTETVEGFPNVTLYRIPAKSMGINGIPEPGDWDPTLDALLHFSDTQLSVPRVYAWCRKNRVRYLPYIGVIQSHSTGKLKETVINCLSNRNLRIYKKCECLVKTPYVREALERKGVTRIRVTPVGLDLSLMNPAYAAVDPKDAKRKYGFPEEARVLLFVGRMTEEKRPLEMIDIFARLYQKNPAYRLLMIGSGELDDAVKTKIKESRLSAVTQCVESVPNREMWEVYRMADAFINLNRQEIFGMAILEAMYYGIKTVAYHAPGPDFIIEDGVSGYLAEDVGDVVAAVTEKPEVSGAAHERILRSFTWDAMAGAVLEHLHTAGV